MGSTSAQVTTETVLPEMRATGAAACLHCLHNLAPGLGVLPGLLAVQLRHRLL